MLPDLAPVRWRAPNALAASLAAVRELAARRAILDRHERDAGPDRLAVALDALFTEARSGAAIARAGAVAVASWIAHRASATPEALDPLADAAARSALPLVGAVLGGGEATASLPVRGRLQEVCIAPRRSFAVPYDDGHAGRLSFYASGWGFRHRERLRAHHDPIMIGRLLDESWVDLRDALVVASRRPSVPGIAWAVATRDRWFGEARVREALAANPFTPATLVLALLPSTSAATLRALAEGRSGDVARAAILFL